MSSGIQDRCGEADIVLVAFIAVVRQKCLTFDPRWHVSVLTERERERQREELVVNRNQLALVLKCVPAITAPSRARIRCGILGWCQYLNSITRAPEYAHECMRACTDVQTLVCHYTAARLEANYRSAVFLLRLCYTHKAITVVVSGHWVITSSGGGVLSGALHLRDTTAC